MFPIWWGVKFLKTKQLYYQNSLRVAEHSKNLREVVVETPSEVVQKHRLSDSQEAFLIRQGKTQTISIYNKMHFFINSTYKSCLGLQNTVYMYYWILCHIDVLPHKKSYRRTIDCICRQDSLFTFHACIFIHICISYFIPLIGTLGFPFVAEYLQQTWPNHKFYKQDKPAAFHCKKFIRIWQPRFKNFPWSIGHFCSMNIVGLDHQHRWFYWK